MIPKTIHLPQNILEMNHPKSMYKVTGACNKEAPSKKLKNNDEN